MTIQEFAKIANVYYLLDCQNDDSVDDMFIVVKKAYTTLSKEDQDLVNTLCDARLTDFLC